jgi:hypothetical protein
METNDEFLSGHPVPDQYALERHPKIHANDVLDDLYHATMYQPKFLLTQHGVLCLQVRLDDRSTVLPKMYADVYASTNGGSHSRKAAISGMMFEEGNEVLEGSSVRSLMCMLRSSTTRWVLLAVLPGSHKMTRWWAAPDSSKALANSPPMSS